MKILISKFYLYIGAIISIIIIHIVLKILINKNSKEFDKRIISNIDIFKSTTNINDIFNKLLNNLYKNSSYDAAISIYINDTDFKIMACHGNVVEQNISNCIHDEKFINLINRVTKSGTMFYIQDLNKVDYALYSTKLQLLLYHMRSLLMIPIIYKDEIYGVVIMVNYKKAAYNENF